MARIGLFDVVGPIMVGPSSSHTAGAVRLGLATRRILGKDVTKAQVTLHGSFAATYWGHRTDVALIAGLLGMAMDDERIPHALEIAEEAGLEYTFEHGDLGDVHPNSVRIQAEGSEDKVVIAGASVGGGRINIFEVNGFDVGVDGTYTTLMTMHRDEPGVIAEVTKVLAIHGINIAFLDVSRKTRGSKALLLAETDDLIPDLALQHVMRIPGVIVVRILPRF
ncbi:MAG TPA: L-serine ammonia-lyase, iron-sulfur-dependent, subunit beta [Firmicutes bacterium]|jgi:L-serine dehydratase|nr:L-serine ammonia-lyase, iron-sulfur-dependent, subunit beta [Bacillota bacterium]